ncbi:flagellar hook-basal body complex protein FliE [Clostridium sp. MT-14]|jgi:flagellar hook-basal body complex protein FliE|uniref:Flagellar hook-basal body complex protein FliE n=1 Tax=Clostridium aromativorans TaxID=2836848 RepID=A0ABS8N2D7_9CLOT|nr:MULTISPECIES: flagellar hook-basal body complex protein FliE [Clostridium]KAA8675182.1 flagellar hook-basal body complex protein FliE [Clostridium sp. HV4-5-A1G]MCC9293974.1 flagellar hook-basal body complex protein FliE [Clostridium aromativorans]CAB1241986.1 Flagellar hook-basal body complex protein FliE [Clostridiaceae bacterium BL-3]
MRINEYVPDSSVFDFNKSVQDSNLNGNNTVVNNLNNAISEDGKVDGSTDENDSSISDFASMLKNELDEVNDQQVQADNSTKELIEGDRTDIHNVMLDTEQAKMSLELAVQIRNKLVDAYQELNRTQL